MRNNYSVQYFQSPDAPNFIYKKLACNKLRIEYFQSSALQQISNQIFWQISTDMSFFASTWAFFIHISSCWFPHTKYGKILAHAYSQDHAFSFFENFYIYHNFIFKGATQNNKNISLTFTKMKSWKLNFVTLSLRIYGSVFYNIFNTKVFKLPL